MAEMPVQGCRTTVFVPGSGAAAIFEVDVFAVVVVADAAMVVAEGGGWFSGRHPDLPDVRFPVASSKLGTGVSLSLVFAFAFEV